MSFEPKKQTFNSKINAVTVGTGDKAVVFGGTNVLPFYTFDGPIENKPKIGIELTDAGMAMCTTEGMKAFYEGCTTIADMAKKASTQEGVSFIALHLEGADPNGENKSVEECVELAKSVADATDLPIVVMGCKNAEKDAELFGKVSEALAGKNILVMSAVEDNYKTVGASAGLAYNQKVGAETAVDINLAKQLNTVLTQLGVNDQAIVMNAGSSAVGYGFEYLASTLDRIKAAALQQGDAQLQMPIITPVSPETWGVKESTALEEEMPEWGSLDERAIEMEIATASACLAGGSDAVIMRHPAAIHTISQMIDALV